MTSYFQLTFNKTDISRANPKIKVLSYNVRVFDLWNWSLNKQTANKIFSFIRKSNSDILCLQEFYSKKDVGKNAVDSIMTNSHLKYSHISYTIHKNKLSNYGIATFSSFPVVNRGEVKMKESDNYCIYTDLKIYSDTIRVYNLHLESLHLGEKDYELLENINTDDEQNVEGYKSIFWKFKISYKKRAKQVKTVVNHMNSCKYRIILCGDFNDTPVSYAYHQLADKLDDAFKLSGNGIGSTYINKYKTFRIDYILHSPDLISFNYRVPNIELSDHFPVQCFFNIH